MSIRVPLAVTILGLFLAAGVAHAGDKPAAPAPAPKAAAAPSDVVQVGDTVYMCGCGPQCTCKPHVSAKPAQCGCKKDMVPVKVTKVSKGEITVKLANGTEEVVKTPYTCGCGASCSCQTAGMGPGKCTCGKPMVKNE